MKNFGGQKALFLNSKAGGRYNKHWVSKGSDTLSFHPCVILPSGFSFEVFSTANVHAFPTIITKL
jgi:hypothetical protein